MSNFRKSMMACLFVVLAGSVMAMGGGKGMKGNMPTYSDFDLDGDGKIVEQEFNQAHAKRMSEVAAEGRQMKHAGEFPGFAGIDSNDDGVISEQEFATHQAEHRSEMQKMKAEKAAAKTD